MCQSVEKQTLKAAISPYDEANWHPNSMPARIVLGRAFYSWLALCEIILFFIILLCVRLLEYRYMSLNLISFACRTSKFFNSDFSKIDITAV